jgi:uncharacterized protein YecE (DUF72 family)
MAKARIGVSGWSYDSWRGKFYPDDLPRRRQLEHASRRFNSIEINGSFYSLLKPEIYRGWYEETPSGFRFAVKGSRFITHNKKLRDVRTPLANFLASGVLALEEKLGPIVWQVSSSLKFDAERMGGFLEMLPRDTDKAAALAKRHDGRVKGRSWLRTDRKRRLRHAIEVRNDSFFCPEFVRLLQDNGTALVFSDAADWPLREEVTAGFVYLRLHGSGKTYASRYSDAELDEWGNRIERWLNAEEPDDARRITDRKPPRRKGRDVYIYFDNDQHAYAPNDAERLMKRLGVEGD